MLDLFMVKLSTNKPHILKTHTLACECSRIFLYSNVTIKVNEIILIKATTSSSEEEAKDKTEHKRKNPESICEGDAKRRRHGANVAEDEGKSEKEAKTKMIGNVVVVEEEESTLDEGIGTKDKSDSEPEVVDLTDDVEVSFRFFKRIPFHRYRIIGG